MKNYNSSSGDIFLTRNFGGEENNPTPLFWNHAAISCGNYIIEAQEDYGIIATSIPGFIARYPEYCVIRYFDGITAYHASQVAYEMVGLEYRKIASLFRFLRPKTLGENCVSVVRKSWKVALGKDPRWRFPTHIYNEVGYGKFELIKHHKDYDNWIEPKNKWEGRLA